MWKCHRSATTNESNPARNGFSFENINQDVDGFLVDFWAGMGGFMYAIGTWLFRYANTVE
jgi:hypothetical protein